MILLASGLSALAIAEDVQASSGLAASFTAEQLTGGELYTFDHDPFETGEWRAGRNQNNRLEVVDGVLEMWVEGAGSNPYLNAYPPYSRDMTDFMLDFDIRPMDHGGFRQLLGSRAGQLEINFEESQIRIRNGWPHTLVPHTPVLGDWYHVSVDMRSDGTAFVRIDHGSDTIYEEQLSTSVDPSRMNDILAGFGTRTQEYHLDNYHLRWFEGTATTADVLDFVDTSITDADVTAWEWSFGDGTTSTLEAPSHRYADDGVYTACLTIEDATGATDQGCRAITILNVAPVAAFTFSPEQPTDVEAVSFADASTDTDGTIDSWSWEFGDGTTSTVQNPSHQFADDGEFQVCLTVTDDDGASTQTCQDVTVLNVAPIASFTSAPDALRTITPVTLEDTSTDADGSIASRLWDLGDGTTSTDAVVEHQYATAGTYTVCLTVTDDDGAQDDACQHLLVEAVEARGRGAGLRVAAPVIPFALPVEDSYGDTGELRSEGSDSRQASHVDVDQGALQATGLGGSTVLSLGRGHAEGYVGEASVTLPSGDVLSFDGLRAEADASCWGSSARFDGAVRLNGAVLIDSVDAVPPGTTLALPGGAVLALRQTEVRDHAVTASAAHVQVPGGLDVTLATASAGVTNCV